MDDHRRTKINWVSITGWILSLAAFGFIGRWLWSLDRRAWHVFATLQPWWLIGALVLWIVWFLGRYGLWERISRRHGYEATRGGNLRMWALSELMRYIPGNVWSFGARYQGTVAQGTAKKNAAQALVIEAMSLVSGATLMSLAVIPSHRWLIIAAIGIVVYIVALPKIFTIVWRRWRHEDAVSLPTSEMMTLLVGYSVTWMIYGLANLLTYWAFPAMPHVAVWSFIGINVLSWLVGYLSIVTPMGLGVREVVFAGLMQKTLTAALASTFALISRVWMIIAEIIFVGGVLMITRWRRT